MVAIKKSDQAAAAARRKARQQARKECCQVSEATLVAADWVILVTPVTSALVTPLTPERFPTADVLALYRLR
jgi:FMN-dependent NADH-azoreductase